jgi:hypothetical protein
VPPDQRKGSDEFLLAEYQHFADSFWRTEELGEKRVNFFISLVTAVVIALVALAQDKGRFSTTQVEGIAFAAGTALLMVGIFTFMRMIRRNDVTDQYKKAMDMIREHFRAAGNMNDYEPFEKLPRMLGTGGLAQTVALLNSLIAGGVAAAGFLFFTRPSLIAIPALAGFALTLGVHFDVLRRRYRKA